MSGNSEKIYNAQNKAKKVKRVPMFDSLRPILNRVIGYPGAEEERELVRKAQAGDKQARERLTIAMAKLCAKIVRSSARTPTDAEDLFQEAMIGLQTAIDDFDLKRNNRFTTYATWWIRAYVWRTARRMRDHDSAHGLSVIHLDQEDFELRGWSPSQDDVVNNADADEKVRRAVKKASAKMRSVDAESILRHYTDGEPETLQSIGDRYGLSRERIRQLEEMAKEKFRRRLQHLRAAHV